MRRTAESRGALGHDVHHGLEVGRRAGDHPQDIGRGRLLLERLRKLSVTRLQEFRRNLPLLQRLGQGALDLRI